MAWGSHRFPGIETPVWLHDDIDVRIDIVSESKIGRGQSGAKTLGEDTMTTNVADRPDCIPVHRHEPISAGDITPHRWEAAVPEVDELSFPNQKRFRSIWPAS